MVKGKAGAARRARPARGVGRLSVQSRSLTTIVRESNPETNASLIAEEMDRAVQAAFAAAKSSSAQRASNDGVVDCVHASTPALAPTLDTTGPDSNLITSHQQHALPSCNILLLLCPIDMQQPLARGCLEFQSDDHNNGVTLQILPGLAGLVAVPVTLRVCTPGRADRRSALYVRFRNCALRDA